MGLCVRYGQPSKLHSVMTHPSQEFFLSFQRFLPVRCHCFTALIVIIGKVKAEGTPPSREPPPSPLRHLYPVRIRTSASASMASGEGPLKPLHYLKRTRAAGGGAGEGSAQGSGSPRSSDTGRQASLPTSESGRPSFFRPHASSVYGRTSVSFACPLLPEADQQRQATALGWLLRTSEKSPDTDLRPSIPD